MKLFKKNKADKPEKKVKKAKAEKKVKKLNTKTDKKSKSLKIGARISIMAILMMLIVSSCNTLAVRFYIDLVEEQLLENGRQGMLTLKDYLTSGANEAMAVSKMLASDADIHRYIAENDSASIRRTVNTVVSSDKISYIVVVDNAGKVIFNSAADNQGEDYSGISLIKAALVGSSNTTYLKDFQSKLVQATAVPVKNASGQIIGSIVACEDLVDNKVIDALNKSHGHQYTVFVDDTRTATTIVDEAGNRVVGTKATEDVIEVVMNQREDIILQNELFGHKYASVYSPIVDNNNKVVGMFFSGVSTDEAINKANKLRATTSIITTIATILFAGLFLVYVKKTITTPIQKVTAAANRISNGEIGLSEGTSVELKIKQKDEIGDLADALEATSGMLKEYIGEMSDVLGKIAKGDLTAKPELEYKGDLISIKDSLMLISREINHSMSDIMISSEEVSSGASQVSDGAQSLSQGATEQASEIDSLSDLVKDITSQISSNASNATAASNLVADSTAIVVDGQKTMNSLAEAMAKINEMTAKMEKVVKTIDNFAFQTNILALNATVEAARAGSHGKGFAIVAEEVRSLANKSATAANETGELIEETVEIVESGVALANATTEEFAKVVDLVEEVNAKVEQIADASNAQAAAASKIVVSVDEISRVIQTNSATAEESAAASEELSGLAQTLANIVAKFKLDKKGIDSNNSIRSFTEPSYDSYSEDALSEAEKPVFDRTNTFISKNDTVEDDKYF